MCNTLFAAREHGILAVGFYTKGVKMINKIRFMCGVVMLTGGYVAAAFDLKVYERGLKKEIPWSLTGSAQDLRSDAKHQLQLILRAFVLLRPDVPWADQQKPTLGQIAEAFKVLNAYIVEQKSEEKKRWVLDSIAYITNTYIPEVQKLLESADPAGLPADLAALLDQKKELLKEFSQSILRGQAEPDVNAYRKV